MGEQQGRRGAGSRDRTRCRWGGHASFEQVNVEIDGTGATAVALLADFSIQLHGVALAFGEPLVDVGLERIEYGAAMDCWRDELVEARGAGVATYRVVVQLKVAADASQRTAGRHEFLHRLVSLGGSSRQDAGSAPDIKVRVW
ncbi:hypothetical protein BAW75_16455 [Micromonospora chalcea]|nr:hypothetical protein BAW75_16455 [Micromonospora chalcea]